MAESTAAASEEKLQNHPIFCIDPAEWMEYVYKEVCVTTEDGETHTGRVYTIDPVSQTVVLVTLDEMKVVKLKAVMGHCITNKIVLDDNVEKYKDVFDNLFKSHREENLSPEELKQKQDKLKSWLLKNRIPVSVSGDNSELLMISDALTIEPPYEAENCQSTNEIILGRIQGLISSMPKDIHQW